MKCSIVIPTYNRPKSLINCIQALEKQSYQGEWEIVIINDGGTPVNINSSERINIINQQNKGPAGARNIAAQHARGEYIAFLDDDCEPKIDWLQQLLKHAGQGVMVGGKTINKLEDNRYSETSQLLVSFLYQYFRNTPWHFFTSNNFLVDKKSFMNAGGFDESFKTSAGEDREFCLRWRHAGHKMRYRSEAVILHAHYQTLGSFWKMHLKYGRAAFLFGRKVRQLEVDALKPRISFYISLFDFVQGYERLGFMRRVSASILILLSQVATFLGFLRERLKTST